MGTNFYLKVKDPPGPCHACGHTPAQPKSIHIGKSSAGWCFSLHVYPEDLEQVTDQGPPRPQSLEDWRVRFEGPKFMIEDEYDNPITAKEMMSIITERAQGLRRHPVHDGHCLGPGPDDATYDLIIGWFS